MRVYGVDAGSGLCSGCGSGPNEAIASPPTRGLRLTPLSVCSHPLQRGWTALHWAAYSDASATAELLLGKKANIALQNKVGDA